MGDNLNVGVWTRNAPDIKNGVYKGSDFEVLLFQFILTSLNLRNITWIPVSETGWFSLSDGNSLASHLRSGRIDIHSGMMFYSVERFNLFTFTYPLTYEKISLAVPKASGPPPFLKLFSTSLWSCGFALLFVIKMLHLSHPICIPISIGKLRSMQLTFILIAIGLSASSKCFKINLTALAVAPNTEVPRTIQQLAEQLNTGSYRLTDKGTSTFIYEKVNGTNNNTDYSILKRALDKFPVHIVSAERICQTVAKSTVDKSTKYVYLNYEERILQLCPKYLSEIQIFPVASSPVNSQSFIMSPNSTKLRNSVNRLIFSGIIGSHRRYKFLGQSRWKTELYKREMTVSKSAKFSKFRQVSFYREVFEVFLCAMGICSLIFTLEWTVYKQLINSWLI